MLVFSSGLLDLVEMPGLGGGCISNFYSMLYALNLKFGGEDRLL